MTDTTPIPADRPADQLRDQIADALTSWAFRGKTPEHSGILATVRANAYSRTDAVLSVLPAPALAVARQLLGTSEGDAEPGCAMPGFVSCDCDHVTGCQHPAEPTPGTDLRERIRSAITNYPVAAWTPENLAGRVMRVVETEAAPPAPADRAAALNETADRIQRRATQLGAVYLRADQVIDAIRRIADEKAEEDRLADDAAAGVQPPTTSEAEPARRRLTPTEHDRAWHAIEGSAGEPGADPDTILTAVLHALRIDTPTPAEEQAASPTRRPTKETTR